ncbi:hypothetical protein PVAND_016287 [Polypedilum vanderplanki]|nr:hypothetical protein PVAND_016287 [Polypedilum vanderplanki]
MEILQEIPRANNVQKIEMDDLSERAQNDTSFKTDEELLSMGESSAREYFDLKIIHHGMSRYECTHKICKSKPGKTLSNGANSKGQHVRRHIEKLFKKFTCQTCKRAFASKKNLLNHVKLCK